MARWQMTEEAYLFTDPVSEWEHTETDQATGRRMRKVYKVPTYIEKETFVSDGNGAQPRDIIFKGPPTPAMQPLDEEAEKLNAAESHKWIHPIESLATTGGSMIPTIDGRGVPSITLSVPPPEAMDRPRGFRRS